jgi:hypothetical protein
MHTESSDPRARGSRGLQRAIVLVVLSEDAEGRGWSRAELGQGLGVEPGELAGALGELLDTGVLQQRESRVSPSSAARRLDELELIAI